MTGRARTAPALLVAAGTSAAVLGVLDRLTGNGYRRQNYRGGTVSLSAGAAVAAGLLAGAAAVPTAWRPVWCAVGGAAAAGAYDDWASSREDERRVKGFAGHLKALRSGRASAGTVKLVVVGASALGAGRLRRGATAEAVLDGLLVAGSANLANLLDLRPGRTLKVLVTLTGLKAPTLPRASRPLAAATLGAAVAVLPADLGERSMLGDTGANAAGAMVGLLLCESDTATRLGCLAAVVALTGLSEKLSFSAVVARNPLLRRLDELGRAGG